MAAVEQSLSCLGEAVRDGRMQETSQFYTRFLEMLGYTVCGWTLLEGAAQATQALARSQSDTEAAFYRGKLKTTRYFFANILPTVQQHHQVIANLAEAAITVSLDELVMEDSHDANHFSTTI